MSNPTGNLPNQALSLAAMAQAAAAAAAAVGSNVNPGPIPTSNIAPVTSSQLLSSTGMFVPPPPPSNVVVGCRNAANFAGFLAALDRGVVGGVSGVGGGTATGAVHPSERAIGPVPTVAGSPEAEKIYQCINDLLSSETREAALMELSRKREAVSDLAVMLWHSFGSIAALLQEIIAVYPTIHPPTLNAHQSNRVCNALALLQCVASHPETRAAFLQANIPLYLYPFLNMNTSSKTRPFEYLRLTSLGVIGALVKTDEKEVINFLLKNLYSILDTL